MPLSKSGDLELRVFTTNYRVFDRYQEPVVSLVVLGDDRLKWRPWRFGWKLWGCEVGIRFPSAKLIDYNRRKLERMAETKPFAIVVLAQLEAQATSKTPDGRLRAKFGLIRRLYEGGYDRGKIKALFRFIDWVMWLPKIYEQKLRTDLERLDTEKKMQYVTSWERMGIEKGIEKGLVQGKAAMLRRQLVRRFGELPEWAERRLTDADSDELDQWGESLLEAKNLTSVFTGPDAEA